MKLFSIEKSIISAFALSGILLLIAGFTSQSGSIFLYILAAFMPATGFFLLKQFRAGLQGAIEKASAIGNGDLNSEFGHASGGALGKLYNALSNISNQYEDKLIDMVIESQKLAAIHEEINVMVGNFLVKAQSMEESTTSVATATTEMSANTNNISQVTEAATSSINQISTNTSEMTHTVNEISSNTERTRVVAQNAVKSVSEATAKISGLQEQAGEISKVIDVIEEISEQTKLLALNATIEAARAGESGKGFAVVANEVKELAVQTAEATEDIKNSVFQIQNSTTSATDVIKSIQGIISEVENNISSIASAVEEQSTSTKDISSNIDSTANGMQEASMNISQSVEVSETIAKDMVKINMGTKQIYQDSLNIEKQVKQLDEVNKNLDMLKGGFSFSSQNSQKLSRTIEVANLFKDREKDHLIWAKKVQNAVADREQTVDVQKDHTLCALGKFLHSDLRTQIEKQNPELKSIIGQMVEPHKNLHDSVVALEDMLQNPNIPDSDINNLYYSTTDKSLRTLLNLFHQAIKANFSSMRN